MNTSQAVATRRVRMAALCAAGWLLVGQVALAQGTGIFSCTDASGRRITSDRPIPECMDREQKELGRTGVVRRVVPPSYTAAERAQMEAKAQAEREQKAQADEAQRRERALLIRYPDQAAHDKARAQSLAPIQDITASIQARIKTLTQQRQAIDSELALYQPNPASVPPVLRRKVEDNDEQQRVQQRALDAQAKEKQRVNARFDAEEERLRPLWQRR